MTKRFLAVCDPAWNADDGGGDRGANSEYETHDVDAMAFQYRRSEPWVDVGDGLLFMWATTGAFNAGDAHALARALHFRVCAGFIWVKASDLTSSYEALLHAAASAAPREDDLASLRERGVFSPQHPGLGQWSRCQHEHLLLCRRGDVSVPPPEARPHSVIFDPRVTKPGTNVVAHSAKPDKSWTQVIEPISRACLSGVRGVEFNSRARRIGWSAYGRLNGETLPDGKPAPLIYEVGED